MPKPASNRVKKTEPKPGKFWCWGCDAALVNAGAKCTRCGNRNGPTKHQKI